MLMVALPIELKIGSRAIGYCMVWSGLVARATTAKLPAFGTSSFAVFAQHGSNDER